jgi:uncharacterized membrane protein
MRPSIATVLGAALSIALAACTGTDHPVGPDPASPQLAPEPSVVSFGMTMLGDPEGVSGAGAINEVGQVVISQGSNPSRPFVWTNGGLQTLLAPFDARQVQAFDLNVDAVVVGDVDGQAAEWVNGELTMLQVPAEAVSSQAFAINDAGQIVGQAFLGVGIPPTAALWQDKDQPMTPLPGSGGVAQAINNAGAIVGISLDQDQNFLRGAYWQSPTTAPVFLNGPSGQPCGSPSDINDRGEIVGFCGAGAAYWSSAGANAIVVGVDAGARAINELGQIVGTTRNSQFDSRPTLWHREGASFRGFDLGLPAGYDEGGVRDLNNHGEAVGGANIDFSGLGLIWHIPARVELDVVPGAATSVKLVGAGTVAPALLGSPWFHAGDIDPASLTLGNDNGNETPIVRKKGTPAARLTDVNRDGQLDLVAEFDKQAMTKNGDLVSGSQVLIVQGRLRDGTRIRGADRVVGVR